jgi:c(7)-type cytochrome triheme protein
VNRTAIVVFTTGCIVYLLLSSCTQSGFISGTRSANYVVEGGAETGKRWVDYRDFATEVDTEKLTEDKIHDLKNTSLPTLQNPAESMSAFPIDRRGAVDWVKALDLGVVNPRADLLGKQEMLVMDMDIMFKDTGNMPWVRFPHIEHTKWLACENCHPKIFKPQKGSNNPSMDGILAGEHCGRCHDKVAFALWVCERCHSVPHKNSPEKWWK